MNIDDVESLVDAIDGGQTGSGPLERKGFEPS